MEIINPRTRFAPSPTGMLHLGNANTALFNWMIARKYGGAVVLRIEDTDLERSTENFEKAIIRDLEWLGIEWDEGPDKGGPFGPYRQMERTQIYRESIEKIIDSGAAYRCYCTKEEIEAERELAMREKRSPHYSGKCRSLTREDWNRLDSEGRRFAVRLRTPPGERLVVEDLIRGEIVFMSDELDDFIIVRSTGVPVFLLTNAVDDALMRISHVVRGEDHISNTPKQILIMRALGYPPPKYLHTPIILGPDRTKLSKRHGAVSVSMFREQGYLPEAMVNYLAFLGWNPKDDREFFSLPELAEAFSVEAMSKSPSVFDYDRLKYLNAHWLQAADRARVVELCAGYMASRNWIPAPPDRAAMEKVEKVVAAVGDRLKTFEDLDVNADFFFHDVENYDPKGVKKHFPGPETAGTLEMISGELNKIEPFTAAEIEKLYHTLVEEKGIPAKKVIHPSRLALTGKTIGPGLFELMEVLGKNECIARLEKAAGWIRKVV